MVLFLISCTNKLARVSISDVVIPMHSRMSLSNSLIKGTEIEKEVLKFKKTHSFIDKKENGEYFDAWGIAYFDAWGIEYLDA